MCKIINKEIIYVGELGRLLSAIMVLLLALRFSLVRAIGRTGRGQSIGRCWIA